MLMLLFLCLFIIQIFEFERRGLFNWTSEKSRQRNTIELLPCTKCTKHWTKFTVTEQRYEQLNIAHIEAETETTCEVF